MASFSDTDPAPGSGTDLTEPRSAIPPDHTDPPQTNGQGARSRPRGWFAGRIAALMGTPYAYPVLFIGALLESTIFPWPIEFVLAGMMLEDRRRVPMVTAIAVLGSVLGGTVFFLIGAEFFDSLGRPMVEGLGMEEDFEEKRQRFQAYSIWIIFIAAQTPVPFQITTLAAGVAGVAFWPFLIAALLARTMRYAMMAVPLYYFGPGLRRWWAGLHRGVRVGVQILLVLLFVIALAVPFL